MARAAKLSDREGLSLRDQAADVVDVPVGHLDRRVVIDPDQAEWRPIDPPVRDPGVGHLADESLADQAHGLAKECIEAEGG